MKQSIYVEGNSEAAGSLLLHFAILLAHHRLLPESFVWHVSRSRDLKLLLLVGGQPDVLKIFVEECRNQVGVQYLWQGTIPQNGSLAARISELEVQLRQLCDRPTLPPEADLS